MMPVAAADVRARRRPRAVAATFAYVLVTSYLVAMPIHAWAKRVWGAHPVGDELLFRPDGRALLTWIGEGDAAIAVVLSSSFMLLLAAVVLGNIVLGALVAALATTDGRRTDPIRVGFAAFIPVFGTSIAAGALQAMLVAGGMYAGAAAAHFCEPRYGDATGFQARVVAIALFVVLAALVGIVADVARVAIARDVAVSETRVSALRRIGAGAREAIGLARRRPGRLLLEWAARAVPSFALFALGFSVGGWVGGRGGAALAALFVAHQLVVVGRVALRASWLAGILRLGV